MKPKKTEHSNTALTHPQADPIPVEKLRFRNEATDQEEPGFESTWEPDNGERKALINGAPLVLSLWGNQHPRIKLEVGEPDMGAVRLYTHDHVALALSKFLGDFGQYMREVEVKAAAEEEVPDDGERAAHTVDLFWNAIDETRGEALRKAEKLLRDASVERNGGGGRP